jgi:hypothetical protein
MPGRVPGSNARSKIGLDRLKRSSSIGGLFYGVAVIATAAALQVINFAVWNRFWPFFAAVFVHLFAVLVQFLRLILLPPHRSGDS